MYIHNSIVVSPGGAGLTGTWSCLRLGECLSTGVRAPVFYGNLREQLLQKSSKISGSLREFTG